MVNHRGVIYFLFAVLLPCSHSYAQDHDNYELKLQEHADSLTKNFFGQSFFAGNVLEVDSVLSWIDESETSWLWSVADQGQTRSMLDDPHKQLLHCTIITFGKFDSIPQSSPSSDTIWPSDSGGVAIIRDDKIINFSKRFLLDYSVLRTNIQGFSDLNNDGTVDIVISIGNDRGYDEGLWLVSLKEPGGKLLNSFSDNGISTIFGASGMFEIRQSLDGPTKEIVGWDREADRSELFRWNGSMFAKVNDQ